MNTLIKNNIGNLVKFVMKFDPKLGVAVVAIGGATYLVCESVSILVDKAVAAGYNMDFSIPGIVTLKMTKKQFSGR